MQEGVPERDSGEKEEEGKGLRKAKKKKKGARMDDGGMGRNGGEDCVSG